MGWVPCHDVASEADAELLSLAVGVVTLPAGLAPAPFDVILGWAAVVLQSAFVLAYLRLSGSPPADPSPMLRQAPRVPVPAV